METSIKTFSKNENDVGLLEDIMTNEKEWKQEIILMVYICIAE